MSSSSPFRSPSWRRLVAGVLALGALVSCEVGKLFQDGGSDPAPARLEFAAPPNGTAGELLSPAVRVSAIDSSGSVDTAFHGTVTLTLGEHPEGAALRGTRILDAVRGVASFADLSINRAGTGYTLVATAPGVRGATRPTFAVAPATAARLAFTAQPHNATVDSVLKPPVQVTALDSLGNVATSFAADVTVALAANASGGTLGGTTTVPATSGVATFADLSVNRAGRGYRLTASAGQLAGATSDSSFDITAAPPTTGDLTVNATTTGDNRPGSYTVKVDGGLSRTIAANGAGTTYSGLSAGDHTVALTDVPANCTVSGGASKTVTVPAGGAATAAFTISCTALTGNLTVSTTTAGANLDPDGYTFAVDGGTPQPIGINATIPLTGIPTGSRTVELAGVAANCTVTGGASQTVTVPPGGSATAAFTITCTQLTGSVTVTTSTSGGTPDSNGYTVTVTGGGSKAIGTNDSVTFSGLATGSHTVTLSGIQSNCSVSGGASRPVTVATGQTASVPFTIDCPTVPPPTGDLTVTAATTGQDLDPDGYIVTVDGGRSRSLGINTSTTYPGLTATSHTVELTGIAGNCTVSGQNPRTITVATSGTTTTFTISCAALPPPTGDLTVTNSTTGQDLDPDGYTVTVDGGQSRSLGVNTSTTYSGLTATSHTVELTGIAGNCTVSGQNPRTVTVATSGTTTTFTITCAALPPPTGDLTVTNSTTGQDLDPDGYTVTVDGGQSRSLGVNTSTTYSGLTATSHTVELTGIAGNCTVSGQNPRTVTVATSGTTTTFSITCAAITGSLTVTTSTSGPNAPSSYTVTVDGSQSKSIAASGNVSYGGLATGSHTVQLNGVPSNCSVAEANPQTVTVSAGSTAQASFAITCAAPPFGGATHLVFTDDPQTVQVGQVMPPVRATVYDGSDNEVAGFIGTVTTEIDSNPGNGTLSTARKTIQMNNPVAQWTDLSIDQPGNGYVLRATSPGLVSAISDPFDVTVGPAPSPAGATGLAYYIEPTTTRAGNVIPLIRVGAQTGGSLNTSFNGAVWITLSSNPTGAVLSGTRRVQVVNGYADFTDLRIDKPGSGYVLHATCWPLNEKYSQAFTISP